ncbi:MAG: hypothetical protein K0Q50_1946 [Vampirovibrio sp.]|nr:hypothetical protein [Vampirovibrio sp.]
MYRESPTAVSRNKESTPSVLDRLACWVFLLAYFTFLPILITILLNWAVYSFAVNNLYQESWMMPSLLLFSTFLAGALMRQKMEDETGGLSLFVIGILALMVFSVLTYEDIHRLGGIYSQFMPRFLVPTMEDYVYMLPGVGIAGMLFYKYFTLKHYS